jgi:hypothetical protein
MTDSATPPPPKLPDIESPPAENLLDGVPSKEEVVAKAASAEEIVAGQPSVDELLGRNH